ncbi:MAG: ribonuclease III [Candidatus Cloacimonetes bacterium]|nr:ribonuclease III [Candidatus Cloacimonadota bacterium]
MKKIIKSFVSQISSKDSNFKEFKKFQKIIGYNFSNPSLLIAALTHTSREPLNTKGSLFERMEFLGDSILGLIVSEELFLEYPEYSEGELSKLKSKIVSRKMLALVSSNLKLKTVIIFNNDSTGKGGLNSLLSNTMESLICAIYLDGNIETTRKFVKQFVLKNYSIHLKKGHLTDYKSKLQEHTQSEFQATPDYHIQKAEGPEHEKMFTIQVTIKDEIYGLGKGPSKKAAQQDAARHACKKLGL